MATDLIRLMHALFLPAAEGQGTTPWRPALDIGRTRTGWLIKCDLAGVRPQDVTLIGEGNRLRIRGCRRDVGGEEVQCHYRMEISYCSFERTIELPCNLARARVVTEFRDGMLLIRIQEEAQI